MEVDGVKDSKAEESWVSVQLGSDHSCQDETRETCLPEITRGNAISHHSR